jgi:hypothetical protein
MSPWGNLNVRSLRVPFVRSSQVLPAALWPPHSPLVLVLPWPPHSPLVLVLPCDPY